MKTFDHKSEARLIIEYMKLESLTLSLFFKEEYSISFKESKPTIFFYPGYVYILPDNIDIYYVIYYKLDCRSRGDVPDFKLPKRTPKHCERCCHLY